MPTDAHLDDDLVTVGRFLDPTEAHMARSALEAAGIASFLQGENANNIMPMTFRTRLLVSPQDEASARELLASAEAGTLDAARGAPEV